ncbi:GLPGLI family protein [Chryseobacterium scophthalmum]|uniref:GLPGLI family protein n=1 Tax=Chryseobacterium scophthalmum TaxID=59733 RepID=UPI0021CDA113|nr:GLPGLI family protein [Chryseobacterium scophthalmum]
MASEQKTIGKYKVQKAETNYGGRNWVAWFTTELPFSNGPYIFGGLPGLIISIQDTDNHYSFNLTEVKKGGNLFDTRTKTVKIDWKKYETLAKSYYNDPFDLLSKTGRKVTMTDANGNKVDITERIKVMQNYIQEEDNPLELNHKINYK